MATEHEFEVTANGKTWRTVSAQADYDAIHVVAGAVLAGAEHVTIERITGGDN